MAYIQERWSIEYSVSGLNKLLHRQGFTYKKPKGRPYKANLAKQAAFMKKYKALKASLNNSEKIFLSMLFTHHKQTN